MIVGKLLMHDYNQNSLENLINNPKSLVLFYADWCPFCKSFKSIFEKLADKTDNAQMLMGGIKLNDDDNPLWDRYQINAVPTLIAFSRGCIISRKDAKMGIGLTKKELDDIVLEIMGKDFEK